MTEGTRSRFAGAWLTAGRTIDSTSSMPSVPTASPTGGLTFAFLCRWMWIHITSNMNSGTAMWMNTISVKKRPLSVSLLRKLLAIDWPKMPRLSSHSVEAIAMYWASTSQTIQ